MANSRNTKGPRIRPENYWNKAGALRLGDDTPFFQLLPAVLFGAIVILIVRLHTYERNMEQFYWSSSGGQVTDFFSYFKAALIIVSAVAAFLILMYRFFADELYVRKTPIYIPMAIFSAFVIISYIACAPEYKEFSFIGYNDRFEGMVPLICYMVMLFFIINSVNSEKNVKLIIGAAAVMSVLLSLLGLSQGLDHDFFRTAFGKKLITPSWFWDNVDSLNFTFQNKEIYQTVYNINYVSFYLTLLIPLFGMLFIRSFMKGKEEPLWKKIFLGVLFLLLIYNIVGAASSGGFLGMFIVVVAAVIMLNKRIIKWWKPVLILVLIAAVVFSCTTDRWFGEVAGTIQRSTAAVSDDQSSEADQALKDDEDVTRGSLKPHVEYFDTTDNIVTASFNGNVLTCTLSGDLTDMDDVVLKDSDGKTLKISEDRDSEGYYAIEDKRFRNYCKTACLPDDEGNNYFILNTADHPWLFLLDEEGDVTFRNDIGKTVDLHPVEAIGFEGDAQGFGSGRGYIWSRTLPMMKQTAIIGFGPDTYCLHYPHYDYAGKYNAPSYSNNINIIVDKPHCLYMGLWTGCGGIATLAFIAIIVMYLIQSILTFRRRDFFADDSYRHDTSYLAFAGAGIFFGIIGFAVSALVNDSTVSVMPLFYTLLGTGIAVNILLNNLAPTAGRVKAAEGASGASADVSEVEEKAETVKKAEKTDGAVSAASGKKSSSGKNSGKKGAGKRR